MADDINIGQITEVLNDKADNTSVVHNTGNETIYGNKTLKQNLAWSYDTLDLSTVQDSGSWHTWSQVYDKNGVRASYIETSHQSNGAVQQQFGVQKTIDGTRYSAFLRVRVDSDKTQHYELGTSPESGSNGTDIATTAFVKSVLSGNNVGLATFSKAQNGYYKFNNGLIIQWGELAVDSSGRYTVNFPTAFTSTNYTITAIGVSAGKITTYAYVQYGEKTTTYVQLATTADATHNGVRWMAIGY